MAFDPVSAALDIGGKLIDRLWPDPTQAAAAKLELVKMQQTGELAKLAADTDLAKAQIGTNTVEAASGNPYASSWRPTIGYVCAAALAWVYVINPLFLWLVPLFHLSATPPRITVDDHLWELMTGMLGLAGWRSLDKKNGVSA